MVSAKECDELVVLELELSRWLVAVSQVVNDDLLTCVVLLDVSKQRVVDPEPKLVFDFLLRGQLLFVVSQVVRMPRKRAVHFIDRWHDQLVTANEGLLDLDRQVVMRFDVHLMHQLHVDVDADSLRLAARVQVLNEAIANRLKSLGHAELLALNHLLLRDTHSFLTFLA